MEKLCILAAVLCSLPAFGQMYSTGNITTSGSTCAVTNACIPLTLANSPALSTASATIVVSGTFTGTIQFEASTDGVNFVAIPGVPVAGGTSVSSATAPGTWSFGIAALGYMRARASAFASGTALVTIQASGGTSASPGGSAGTSTSNPLFVNTSTTDPCLNSSIAKSSVPINIATATTTSLVAVSGATTVYVCGFSLTISQVVTTANTIQFEYGTGAACVGSPTALTGLYGAGGVTAAAPIPIHMQGPGTIFKSAASNGVCAVTAIGASGSFQGVLTFVQQ